MLKMCRLYKFIQSLFRVSGHFKHHAINANGLSTTIVPLIAMNSNSETLHNIIHVSKIALIHALNIALNILLHPVFRRFGQDFNNRQIAMFFYNHIRIIISSITYSLNCFSDSA